eukprot:187046-Amorphochlora_amoeboformis.AAC.1
MGEFRNERGDEGYILSILTRSDLCVSVLKIKLITRESNVISVSSVTPAGIRTSASVNQMTE